MKLAFRKFFVEIFQLNYIFGVHKGPHHKKNTKLEKIAKIEKMIPKGGPLEPKNANFSTIDIRAEPPVFFIYILVVYEEYRIKSSKFNIRKIARVRVPPWVFRGHFLHPSKSTLRINGPV